MDGAIVADKPARASSSGNAQIITVEGNPYGIREVQFSPESNVSTHGAQYYKITYANGSKAKIIDPEGGYKLSFKDGEPLYDKNTTYLNPQGQEIIFDPKTNKWVPK
jgi:filamentous hemagglutinin